MHIGPLLASGRTADVYALDGPWVLRRYRRDADSVDELAVLSYLSASGFPVPRIGPPGEAPLPTDLVTQRLTGPTLAEALSAGTLGAPEGGTLLAGLLRELHAIPPRLSQDPEDRILHLDLRPENVVLAPGGAVVVDWCAAAEGRPALDRAMSSLLVAQAALAPSAAGGERARELLAELLSRLAEDGGVPAGSLAAAVARRAADPRLTAEETAALDEAAALVARLAG
ncbi:phosphotransferase [Streptomyces griseus]|uniref:phosphotransferase n=1 Tax=Streptomyces griseus TaxID=1911 RepID=UPI00083FF810|nr:phosphotransferase [Streptomyces griseus]